MADARFAQFASSNPTGPDAAFWDQRVYFDGVPRRRREIVPTLAATPGMSERAARLLLATAPVADKLPAAKPPATWFNSIPTIATPGDADLDGEDDELDEDDEGDKRPNRALPIVG